MFTHMVPVKKVHHTARGVLYELLVYQVAETFEYRIFVVKGSFGVGDIFTASQLGVEDARSSQGVGMVDELISIAVDDIDRNEFGQY